MNDRGIERDRDARLAALDIARSFIVEAPAGSGKTELLLQRFLALLARVERPEAIVAMTFTRKAAGEIRDRILVALRGAEDESPIEPHLALTWRLARAALRRDAALGWNLIAHPARLQVHTIDALCLMLARQAPLAVKLGAMPRMIERADELYVEAARAALDEADAGEGAWQRLLDDLDNNADRLVGLLASLLAKREQWLRHLVTDDPAALRAALEDALAAEIEAELRALAEILPRSSAHRLIELLRHAAANLEVNGEEYRLAAFLEGSELPPANAAGLPRWQAIAGWLLTQKGGFRAQVNKRQGFFAESETGAGRETRKQAMEALLADLSAVPGLAAALHATRRLPPPRYDEAAWRFIAALLDVLPRVAARLELVFAESGAIDFNEATLIALRAMASSDAPSDLLLALDVRIEHLLVDEYQDTSLAQRDLIEKLTAGWTPGDGRTLFVVGDPMQSIYRFRDADVGLFLDAQRRQRIGVVALEPLTLARNFRSQRALVEWVNRIFAQVSSASTPRRNAITFKAAVAARDPEPAPAVTLDVCRSAALEADTVVARIRAALAGDAQSIAILVRKRPDLAELLPALRSAEIPYAAVDLDRFSERQAMLDLASLAHALVQPADRAAWLATLRAPWCGLTLPDLFTLAGGCESGPLCEAIVGPRADELQSRLTSDGRARLARFSAAVAPALRDRGRVPLATMVRGAWLALGGPACVSESIDLDAAQRVLSLLEEHSAGADVADWPAFAAALDALYADQEIDPATRVRVMTLHRAKGLEFDVVVMPALARPAKRPDPELLLWRQRPAGLLLAPTSPTSVDRNDRDPIYAYLRALDAAEDASELARLLYVGCTRAKRSLHLTASLSVERDADGRSRWKHPARGSSLDALWAAVRDEASLPPEEPVAAAGGTAVSGVPLLRLPLAWRLPPPPSMQVAPAAEVLRGTEPVEFDWVRETARQIGMVAHRILRQIAEDGLDSWTLKRVEAQRQRVARDLSALGFTGAEAAAAVEQVLASIRTMLADSRGRWLFDPRHADAHSELAVTEWRDGSFVHRVLDRTFVDAGGTRWIIDFKLSRHEGGGVDAFLDNERERYRAQLDSYAGAMRALDARPIRLGLYFPLLGAWREWSAPV
jgi:ATP-dependent exoDNAse (exonuclease V) beta subunit